MRFSIKLFFELWNPILSSTSAVFGVTFSGSADAWSGCLMDDVKPNAVFKLWAHPQSNSSVASCIRD